MIDSIIYIDAKMLESENTANVLDALLSAISADISTTRLCIITNEAEEEVRKKIADNNLNYLLDFINISFSKYDWIAPPQTTTESEQPIFFSLDPELNRLARHRGWTTIVESCSHMNEDDENEAINKIIETLQNDQPALVALDFDETIVINNHPHKTRGISVINHHAVNFFAKLINRMKEAFKNDFGDKFTHLFSIEIVSTRADDEIIHKHFGENPSVDPTYMKNALPVFIEEVKKLHERNDRHCCETLSGF
jgi:hypothetical protein